VWLERGVARLGLVPGWSAGAVGMQASVSGRAALAGVQVGGLCVCLHACGCVCVWECVGVRGGACWRVVALGLGGCGRGDGL